MQVVVMDGADEGVIGGKSVLEFDLWGRV
ncbi:hypothetical protein A2U01_0073396, partial [Trifolium medium]|nr:hypothetical protein [Trifolium medium]